MKPPKNILSDITVEPLAFMFMFVEQVRVGLVHDLIYYKVCEQQHNNSICDNLQSYNDIQTAVQTESSYWIMVSTVALRVPSLIFVMYLGSWSDIFGRKLPLMLPLIGAIINISLYILISGFYFVPLWVLIPANIIQGVFGSVSTCIMASYAYVSAVSSEESRTVRISIVSAMFKFGGTIGPLVTGAVIGVIGRTYTLCMLLGIVFVNVSYGFLRIVNIKPYSVSGAGISTESWVSKYFSLSHVQQGINTAFKRREGNRRRIIMMFLVAYGVVLMVIGGDANITYLFTVDAPLHWNYSTYSYYNAFKEALGTLSLMVLVPLAKKIGFKDITLCIISSLTYSLGLILLGFSYTTIMMFCAPVLCMFSSVSVMGIRSELSIIVGKKEQAILSDANTVLSSFVYNSLYPKTINFFHGLLYEVSAVFLLVPLILFSCLVRQLYLLTASQGTEVDELPLMENNNLEDELT